MKTGFYREAVTSRRPGLPLRLPWVTRSWRTQPQRGCGLEDNATRSGLMTSAYVPPGLKQPWASRRNRFAVKAIFIS